MRIAPISTQSLKVQNNQNTPKHPSFGVLAGETEFLEKLTKETNLPQYCVEKMKNVLNMLRPHFNEAKFEKYAISFGLEKNHGIATREMDSVYCKVADYTTTPIGTVRKELSPELLDEGKSSFIKKDYWDVGTDLKKWVDEFAEKKQTTVRTEPPHVKPPTEVVPEKPNEVEKYIYDDSKSDVDPGLEMYMHYNDVWL